MYENNNWIEKLKAENKAQKSIDGLPLYRDATSGKVFVNISDLRQKLNNKLP